VNGHDTAGAPVLRAGVPPADGLPDGARRGIADVHVHTMASDGTAGVLDILEHVEHRTDLRVLAVTDHERVDAAIAAREIARDRGLRVEIVVGEEITTRGGHLLALFIEKRIRPLQSLRTSVARVHEQGGLAIASHPLAPYPSCVSERSVRRLHDDPDPIFHLDGLETFNPTTPGRTHHARAVTLAAELGLAAVGGSDAHLLHAIRSGHTGFAGRTAADLRLAILEARTTSHGDFWSFGFQVGMFRSQLRKYSRDIRDQLLGTVTRNGTGRDLGYPGGRARPERYDPAELERVLAERTPRWPRTGRTGQPDAEP
jgi:predicted metal-dependent phosphoesterase TrpH